MFKLFSKNLQTSEKGIASLPAVLLLGGIILEIGIAGSFLLFYLNSNVYATRLANEAMLAAQSGIADATYRLTLDKDWVGGNYTLDIGNRDVDVDACRATCPVAAPVGAGKYYIVSTGNALTQQSRLVAVVSVDEDTGVVTIDSIKEEVD